MDDDEAIAGMVADARRQGLEEAAKMAEDGFWAAEPLSAGAHASKAVWRGKYHDGPSLAQAIRAASLKPL